jgi:DNA-binding transcriptional LysR family regulator
MQLKRLEESLGQPLIDRSGRRLALTAQGEQLLGYARRMVTLNDEAWGRMTNASFEGEINFGVPHDIIYPYVPRVLKRFACEYPRIKVQLHSQVSSRLKEQLAQGEMDLILTTEAEVGPGGEILQREPLVWVGAPNGQAWRTRPLRVASMVGCMFRDPVFAALDEAGLDWDLAVNSGSMPAIEASVSADLAVYAQLESTILGHFERIPHGGALPDLPDYLINMYARQGPRARLAERLAVMVRQTYGVAALAVAAE